MLKNILAVLILITIVLSNSSAQTHKVVKTFHIASSGGWDYISVHKGKIYVSHGTQVNILDEKTGDSVGVILNTQGVHGIAFSDEAGKGFTSNGRSNNVTVFDLKTNNVITQIETGQNPDAIYYEPFTKTIITCNGRSKSLSIIDPLKNKVIDTVALSGKPEEAVSDGKGNLYVNIEDKSEIAVVDTKTWKVTNNWSMKPGDGPSGLKIDSKSMRLFAACDKLMMVLDATNGKVVTQVPIGEGSDGLVFDDKNKIIYTSNGIGNITAIKEQSPNDYVVVETIITKPRARTIAMDDKTHAMFLPTAEFEKPTDPNPNPRARPKMIPGSFQVLVVE